MPTKKNLDNELELKPYSPSFDTFKKEPVTFLLVNALRHLTQDQQRQLCNALQERLPIPDSIEDEAERLYPDLPKDLGTYTGNILSEAKRSAHITCARQYMGEIEKLKELIEKAFYDAMGYDTRRMSSLETETAWNEFKEKHNL